mgnify:CR=1 FL=1
MCIRDSVCSGSLNLGTENEATVNTLTASTGQGLGLFYPDQGLVILNPSAVHSIIGTSIDSGSNGGKSISTSQAYDCLLYTSDAADDMQCVDLGGRRIIKKKKR